MKKFVRALFLVFVAMAFLMAVPVNADKSTLQTDDALIVSKGGTFLGLLAITDGTNSVTFDIYDNTTGSGTKIIPSPVATTSASNRVFAVGFDKDDKVQFYNGIYVDVTTSGTVTYQVYWVKP